MENPKKRIAGRCAVIHFVLALLVLNTEIASANLAVNPSTPFTPKESYYSTRILKFLNSTPPTSRPISTEKNQDEGPVFIRAIETPDHPHTIGMVKQSEVHASIAQIIAVTEKFEDYPKIWKDVLNTKVIASEDHKTIVAFTRKRPAFFLPEIKFQTLYTSDKSNPNKIVYHQQLINGNMVKFSDSIVIIEKITDDRSKIIVYNFFDPDLGLVNLVAESKIWKQSLEAGFKDDVAFAARLEHPDWNIDQITDESEKQLDLHPIKNVEYLKLPEVL